jgi:hypothetical protein
MGQQESKEQTLFTEILRTMLCGRGYKVSKSQPEHFCLKSKSVLKINKIVLCFIV